MENSPIVAVMAGTLVDTQMGIDSLHKKQPGIQTLFYPTARDPKEQMDFQYASMEKKVTTIRRMIRAAKLEGAKALLVYCNSLSTSLDFEAICREEDIILVNPLMAYKDLASRCSRVGFMAANSQSLAGIEKVVYSVNSDCHNIGAGFPPVVFAIEEKLPPAVIVERFGLDHLLRYFEQMQVDCVALGCTHLPYLIDELRSRTHLPIFDPDDFMFELLTKKLNELGVPA